jgi:dienelactone hydrolase/ketosteroid isomerase-like protein
VLAVGLLLAFALRQARADSVRDRSMAFFAAVDAADWPTVEKLIADDFTAVDPRGGLSTRAEYLSDLRAIRAPDRGRIQRTWSGIRTSAHATDAVFSGRLTWRSQNEPDKRPVSSRLVTHHWRLVDDRWRLVASQGVMLPPPPEIVSFPSGQLSLKAMVFRPDGEGPFPAIVYAHGNEPDPSDLFETVGPALAARGYLVFGPHRRGSGLSADQAENLLRRLTAIEQRDGVDARSRVAIAELEGAQLDDIAAAATAARARPDVDPTRVYLIGNSFGGVLVMLAAERGLPFAGAVNFAGAAINWERSSLFRERMLKAAGGAQIPVFVAQAANDFSTAPTVALGQALCSAGKAHRSRVYPVFGVTAGDGHGLGVDGVDRWFDDVFAFLSRPTLPSDCMVQPSRATGGQP